MSDSFMRLSVATGTPGARSTVTSSRARRTTIASPPTDTISPRMRVAVGGGVCAVADEAAETAAANAIEPIQRNDMPLLETEGTASVVHRRCRRAASTRSTA